MHRAILLTLLLSVAPACKTTVQSPTNAPALGSDATIVVKKNSTGTYAIDLEITNLAPPARLDAESTTFVVWIVGQGQPAVRAGTLAYDEGDRRGALQATSPNRVFSVLVTLENEASPASPGGKSILNAAITARK